MIGLNSQIQVQFFLNISITYLCLASTETALVRGSSLQGNQSHFNSCCKVLIKNKICLPIIFTNYLIFALKGPPKNESLVPPFPSPDSTIQIIQLFYIQPFNSGFYPLDTFQQSTFLKCNKTGSVVQQSRAQASKSNFLDSSWLLIL